MKQLEMVKVRWVEFIEFIAEFILVYFCNKFNWFYLFIYLLVLKSPIKSIQFVIAKPIAATLVGEELSDDKELVNSFAYVTSDLSPLLSIPPILSLIHPILHQKFMT